MTYVLFERVTEPLSIVSQISRTLPLTPQGKGMHHCRGRPATSGLYSPTAPLALMPHSASACAAGRIEEPEATVPLGTRQCLQLRE